MNCMINDWKKLKKKMNKNWPTNEKINHEKIMSYKMKAFVFFENTMIQTDSEKIFVTTKETFQKIFWKMENISRYFGWIFEILEKLRLTGIDFMYVSKNIPRLKLEKVHTTKNCLLFVPTQNIKKCIIIQTVKKGESTSIFCAI